MKKESHGFLSLVKKRKTCYEFEGKKISEGDINKILEAARWAPSFSNSQPWRFIIVRKKNMINQLMKSAFYGGFHTYPPVIIAILQPNSLLRKAFPNISDFSSIDYVASISIATAAQNILLEATDLGLGSALLSPVEKQAKAILKAGDDVKIPFLIALGYEKKGAYQKPRTRIELKSLILKELN